MQTRPCGPHRDLPWLGLDHDGAHRNGNKGPQGHAGPKRKLPTRSANSARLEMKAVGSCGAMRGLERSILCWLARDV
jgi:hypothetical protein